MPFIGKWQELAVIIKEDKPTGETYCTYSLIRRNWGNKKKNMKAKGIWGGGDMRQANKENKYLRTTLPTCLKTSL